MEDEILRHGIEEILMNPRRKPVIEQEEDLWNHTPSFDKCPWCEKHIADEDCVFEERDTGENRESQFWAWHRECLAEQAVERAKRPVNSDALRWAVCTEVGARLPGHRRSSLGPCRRVYL